MHLLGQVILEENARETRKDVIGQLREFKRVQQLKKEAEAKGSAIYKEEPSKNVASPKKEATKPVAQPNDVPNLSKGQKKKQRQKQKKQAGAGGTSFYDQIPALCELRKEYLRVTNAACTSVYATNDFVYVGDSKGFLTKISIARQEIDAKLGYMHKEGILAINVTEEGDYVFTADADGSLKQSDSETGELESNFGKLGEAEIICIEILDDHLFIADMNGNMKQISLEERTITKNYGKIHRNSIWGTKATRDGTDQLFTCDGYGYVHQYDINKQKLVKNYGFVHDAGLRSLEMSWDSQYFYTLDKDGITKQWSIADKKVMKATPKHFEDEIYATATSPKYLFVSDMSGAMKMFDAENLEMVKDFGKAHEGTITGMSVSPNGKLLFTCDNGGNVYQWRINDEWDPSTVVIKKPAEIQVEKLDPVQPKKSINTTVKPKVESQKGKVADTSATNSAEFEKHKKIIARTNVDINVVNDKVNAVEMKITDMSNKMNVMELKIDKLISTLVK